MSDHHSDPERTDRPTGIDRRHFLHLTGAAGAAGLAGCPALDGGSTPAATERATPSGPVEGGRLVWGHSEVTQKLDVHVVQTAASNRFLNNVHQTLVGVNDRLEVTADADVEDPGLAADWSVSDDRKTYTFDLREGVTFHDGSTLTSADVRYTFDRIRNPDVGARYRNIVGQIATVETPDDHTVVLDLDDRYNPLLRQLAFLGTAIVPEGSGPDQGDEPVGTGPFAFESRQQGNRAVLAAHDDYWGEGPYLDAVEERTVTDPDSRLTGVQEGSFDYVNDVPLDDMRSVVNDDGDGLRTATWRPLAFNHVYYHTGRPPFDDVGWREAVVYAIDKQELVDGALFGQGTPITSPSYPNSPFRNDDIEPRPQDFAEAERLVAASSYDVSEFSPLTFKVTTNYPWHVDAATIMQQQLAEIGLEIEIQKLQWGDWLSEVIANMNYRMSMVNWFGGWEPAQMYRGLWHSKGAFNSFAYESDRFDEAIEKAETAPTREEEIEWYREAQAVLHEELPSPFLWFRDGAMAAKRTVGGLDTVLDPNNTAVDFGQVWLDE